MEQPGGEGTLWGRLRMCGGTYGAGTLKGGPLMGGEGNPCGRNAIGYEPHAQQGHPMVWILALISATMKLHILSGYESPFIPDTT